MRCMHIFITQSIVSILLASISRSLKFFDIQNAIRKYFSVTYLFDAIAKDFCRVKRTVASGFTYKLPDESHGEW